MFSVFDLDIKFNLHFLPRSTLLCHPKGVHPAQIHARHSLFLHRRSIRVQELLFRLWTPQLGHALPLLSQTQPKVEGNTTVTFLLASHWYTQVTQLSTETTFLRKGRLVVMKRISEKNGRNCVDDSAIVVSICIFIVRVFPSRLKSITTTWLRLRLSIGNDFRLDLMPVAQESRSLGGEKHPRLGYNNKPAITMYDGSQIAKETWKAFKVFVFLLSPSGTP